MTETLFTLELTQDELCFILSSTAYTWAVYHNRIEEADETFIEVTDDIDRLETIGLESLQHKFEKLLPLR
jgi:hypothetical protein